MTGILLTIHILISIGLIIAVMMQKSEGGASLFSGGAERIIKGGTYSVNSFMSKITMYLGIAFFVSSIILAVTYFSGQNFGDQIVEQIEKQTLDSTQENSDDGNLVPIE